jgi:hypothetical protein
VFNTNPVSRDAANRAHSAYARKRAINLQTATGVNDGKRIDRQIDRPRVNDMAVEIRS